jgi:RNA methyltransferase, TrmH family
MPENRDRPSDVIASSSNPGIKTIRSLQRRKARQQERAFVVEGVRAVNDVLASGVVPKAVYLRDDTEPGVLAMTDSGVPVRRVASALFNDMTDTIHPQGVLAVVPMPDNQPLPDVATAPIIMILDRVRDPGNLGTLLRSAAGAGLDHVVIAPECVDPFHPKAVRAAMGAHFRIPVSQLGWGEIGPYAAKLEVVALADAYGEADYDMVPWSSAAAMIVGGEAFGPSPEAHEHANVRVSIPLANGIESLNAGVAGSLLAFEAVRQRRSTSLHGSDGA